MAIEQIKDILAVWTSLVKGAIMRQRHDRAIGLLLVILQVLVEIKGVCAAHWWKRCERHDLPRPVSIVAEDDVPVHVCALYQRGPFKGDERREFTRIVELVRVIDHSVPGMSLVLASDTSRLPTSQVP